MARGWPDRWRLGKFRKAFGRGGVKRGLLAVRIDENVGIDGDQAP